VLTASEVEMILHQPNVADPVGIRDRAMLETFYSTGMRRTELLALAALRCGPRAGIVTIREGKGKKDRVIPIGERAVAWLDKYLQARPQLVAEPDDMTSSLPCRASRSAQPSQRPGPRLRGSGWSSASTEPAISSATRWPR
jgi:site-specific recombinase XerD